MSAVEGCGDTARVGDRVADLLVKFRHEAADSGARTYSAAIIGEIREQIAADIEADDGDGAEVGAVHWDAMERAAKIARGSS